MIKRNILKKLELELKKKNITALIGARQVGKTTILKKLFKKVEKNSIFINFDNITILNIFDNDIEAFIKQYILPFDFIFIDEIQYSKKSGKYLKYIIDSFENKKIFISGSSTPELSIKTLSYLVGRIRIYEIYGISFEEFIEYKDKNKAIILKEESTQIALKQFKMLFEEYLNFGSYPGVIVEKDYDEKKKILKDIINTYLLKEIREILQFENSFKFELLLKRLSITDGKLLNYSNISREIDIKLKKIKEMINILNKTYVLFLLNPFLGNKIKELIKSPKTYYLDLGFKNSLINNFSEINCRLDKGEIYENFILKAILCLEFEINFWNLKNNYEMDFVLEKDGKMYGFEIKSKLSKPKITTSMKKFIEINSPEIVYVLNENLDDEIKYLKTKIKFTNFLNIFQILKKL